MLITIKDLMDIGVTKTRAELYAGLISRYSDDFDINSKMRMSHFLAQILHESGMLKYVKELSSGKQYEGRTDLGNIKEGDGVRYKGRGLLQITGRYGYTKLRKYFDVDFISRPELLESPVWAVRSAMWYWKTHGLNERSDRDEFTKITKIINGGLNGKAERLRLLGKAKRVLGLLKK